MTDATRSMAPATFASRSGQMAPLVVGLGGAAYPDSPAERILRHCLEALERQEARTRIFCAADLDLPMYNPAATARPARAASLIEALRAADAVVIASPSYHSGVSGMVKNALDYLEDLRDDPRAYLDGRPLGCIACGYGWQAATATLGQLRSIGYALRAWPTPLGIAVNSAWPLLDGTGRLTDADIAGQLDELARQLMIATDVTAWNRRSRADTASRTDAAARGDAT
jgi:FMN reductase